MKTAIIGGHVVDTPAHVLTDAEANTITAALAEAGIRVALVTDVFRTVHLWALEPCSTRDEVRAVAAVNRCTDCRLAWHPVTPC